MRTEDLLANQCYYVWEMHKLKSIPTPEAEEAYKILEIKLKHTEVKLLEIKNSILGRTKR